MNFDRELRHLINLCSIENESNTPDFILASFILRSLEAFAHTTQERDKWYGFDGVTGSPRSLAIKRGPTTSQKENANE